MFKIGNINPAGSVGIQVFSQFPARELEYSDIVRFGLPSLRESREVNLWRLRNLPNLWRGLRRIALARVFGIPHFYGQVFLRKIEAGGRIVNYGLASLRVVTDTGVGFIVDAFQNSVELENMKYHGFGTGTNAEAAGNTALQTELTTQYATDNTRPTGTTTEGATANIYRSVATLSPDATVAITEHGIFSQAANSGGVLLDRSVFSAVNLVSGDSLQTTYDYTINSGS
jgi:hypothetical protein